VGYRRVDAVVSLIEAALRSSITRVYVAIDGSKDGDLSLHLEFKKKIKELEAANKIQINCWYRSNNLGLAVSMITAIDWIFGEEDLAIILEDDVTVSKNFFAFIENHQNLLEEMPDLILISGNQFFSETNSPQLINYPLVWGWATSKSNWLRIRHGVLEETQTKFAKNLSLSSRGFWAMGRIRSRKRKIDSWAVPFACFLRLNGFYCLIPPRAFSGTQGVDPEATHSQPQDWFAYTQVSDIEDLKSGMIPVRNSDYNLLLERSVYQIKFIHVFNLIRAKIASKKINRLKDAVSSVLIPGRR
jgi:GR25 family glycosyltransferase involved in LPS biosynthesis